MPIVIRKKQSLSPGYMLLILLLLPVVFITSCKKQPPWKADISSIKIDPVQVKRYDRVLFNIDAANLRQELDPYIEEYYVFLGDEIDTPSGQQQLYEYLQNEFIQEVYTDTQQVWEDTSELDNELTRAFRYYIYHFPEKQIPDIYSYISGIDFEIPVFYQQGTAVIGLDMFLGRDYYNYDRIGVPAFKRVRFIPQAAPLEIMRSLGKYLQMEATEAPAHLLDFMILEGKLLYYMDCIFPDHADSLKIYYTAAQLQWAQKNEGQAWAFLLNNEMLYSGDRQLIQKLTGDTPFTAPFSMGSSPRMGSYHGWMIVREYMRRNPEVSLQQLFNEKRDSRQILSESRYRPR
jgi:hypothetical protein